MLFLIKSEEKIRMASSLIMLFVLLMVLQTIIYVTLGVGKRCAICMCVCLNT